MAHPQVRCADYRHTHGAAAGIKPIVMVMLLIADALLAIGERSLAKGMRAESSTYGTALNNEFANPVGGNKAAVARRLSKDTVTV